MIEDSRPDGAPAEPAVFLDGDISHLGAVSIQIHEMYLQLKKSGFTASEALELSGAVLVAFALPRYEYLDDFQLSVEEEEDNLLEFPEEDEPEQ